MTYNLRLDGKCRAQVLSISDDKVLIKATWPAHDADRKRFQVNSGIAQNIVQVSKSYFTRKYGVVL